MTTTWRTRRLARGWTEIQLIGRMKIVARRKGVALPRTYQLARWVFLWENHRVPTPAYYDGLIADVFTIDTAHRTRLGGVRV